MSKLFLSIVSSIAAVNADAMVSLTPDTWSKVAGQNTIVKFFAPWCGHCKSMAPAWIELADVHNPSGAVMIAEVDCTVEESLCSKYGVQGYPTIKYFMQEDGGEPKDYEGGRDKESFVQFIESTLMPKCTAAMQDKCTDKEKTYIIKMQKKTVEEQEKELTRLTKMMEGDGGKMTGTAKGWVGSRKRILFGMVGKKPEMEPEMAKTEGSGDMDDLDEEL